MTILNLFLIRFPLVLAKKALDSYENPKNGCIGLIPVDLVEVAPYNLVFHDGIFIALLIKFSLIDHSRPETQNLL